LVTLLEKVEVEEENNSICDKDKKKDYKSDEYGYSVHASILPHLLLKRK